MTILAARPAVDAPARTARWWPAVPPLVALAAVGAGLLLGWRGTDVAAAAHRVLLFHRQGFTLWDGTWYGGQWTLDYSVAFAPVAAALGLPLLGLLSAATSALAFERVTGAHLGPGARAAAVVFALGTVVETAIGQYPFLAGEALALTAIWAAARSRWPAAWALALAATLLSPLAGAFAAFAAVAWLAGAIQRPRRWMAACAGVAVAALVPIAVTAVLFPGEGVMPFQGINCVWDVAVAAGVFVLTPRRHRVLRVGAVLYAVVLVASCALRTPVGVNAGRLEDCVALPLAVALVWRRHRLLLAAVAVPLILSEWGPALGAMTTIPGEPSAHRSFYTPLVSWLERVDSGGIDGRVEVVPTASHGESEWVAESIPLARGWERQTDKTDNPIFYRPGTLDDRSYLAWLVANGVRYVALPKGPLDSAGQAEARLVDAGVPGLVPAWHSAEWQVWEVRPSEGLAGGGARVVSVGATGLTVEVRRRGEVTLRVRWNHDWRLDAGRGCVRPTAGGWTLLDAPSPEVVHLAVGLTGAGRCG